MEKMIQYIIEFLLYGDAEAAKLVGYTNEADTAYKVIIRPNGHLGKDWVLPDLSTENVLSVQGSDNPKNGPIVITTDIVYNTAFFISRAEELLNPQRDEHGRFLAKYSILGKDNRLLIPLIDEYSRVLMKALGLPLPPPAFAAVNLTHDIDTLTQYRHLRGATGGVLRGHAKEVFAAWNDINNDPAYTFGWLMKQDLRLVKRLPQTKMIYFVKDTPGKGYDYPQYNLNGKDFRHLAHCLTEHGAILGLHSSYYGNIKLSTGQPDGLSPLSPINYQLNRNHFLRCPIETMRALAAAGITDDYTMGFADTAGFRLQTTRPVRWIDPLTYRLSPLTLHPLTIMDCTLQSEQYMNLNEEEAFYYCQQLIDKTKQHQGELTLLWHNTSIKTAYLGSLYKTLLDTI